MFRLGGQEHEFSWLRASGAQKTEEVVNSIRHPSAGFSSCPVLLPMCATVNTWGNFPNKLPAYKPLSHSAPIRT